MPMFTETSMAWTLTRAMARAVEVDLLGAVADGWLSRAELAGLVDRCGGCCLSNQCSLWLVANPRADRLPDYCLIKHEIEALAG